MKPDLRTTALATALAIALLPVLAVAKPGSPPAPAPAAAPAPPRPVRALDTRSREWTGDFDGMLERRLIRVLVPYSRSLYFNDRGRERGLTADSVRGLERWLNQKHAKQLQKRPLTVLVVPTTRDRLVADLGRGLGDLAIGNLTVTEERLRTVDFASDPDAPEPRELVVTRADAAPLEKAEELSGRTVHVRRASSYFESLAALNARLAFAGSPQVNVVLVPDALEDEDMLEMLDAGILDAVVVDDWKARMWAPILPRLKVHERAVLREGGKLGWAFRKGSPRLRAELEAYLKKEMTRGLVASRVQEYGRYVKRLENPTATMERKRFRQLVSLFEKYGQRYHFDPLMLAAQGYQESRLDQEARSHVGAIGVMQVMPATGEELRVGDIRLTEPNIHAGTKYMDRLMTRHFRDASFDDLNRTLFAFASYNAGPGNMAKMRSAARKRGLDPDQWFNHVEVVTAQRIGIETTTYVRNIYKYYVAYRLMVDADAAVKKAREQVESTTP